MSPLRSGMRVLDLGCGTGDLALLAARRLEGTGEVVGFDFSDEMLKAASRRQAGWGLDNGRIRFLCGKAEDLPVEKELYDLVVSGFVLRNIYERIDRILLGVYRSLKEGGWISFLDITQPANPFVGFCWKLYMATFGVLVGKVLFGKHYPAFYLTQSAERFLKAVDFAEKLKEMGFWDVSVRPFMFGVITLYQAKKPSCGMRREQKIV